MAVTTFPRTNEVNPSIMPSSMNSDTSSNAATSDTEERTAAAEGKSDAYLIIPSATKN